MRKTLLIRIFLESNRRFCREHFSAEIEVQDALDLGNRDLCDHIHITNLSKAQQLIC